MQQVFDAIRSKAAEIATTRQTPIDLVEIPLGIEPAPTNETVRRIVADAAKSLGLSSRFMPSGAAQDAQHMTYLAPSGMIFVPSIGGISHSPKEFTTPEAVANGANVLLRTVLAIDGGALGSASPH
jgi:N-carbamoyl-L-amino-acid hydrolase